MLQMMSTTRGGVPKPSIKRPTPGPGPVGRSRLVARASKPDPSAKNSSTKGTALGCALACLLTLSQGLDVSVAYADSDANLSAYERRKLENERRKEMLRSLREKAEKGAASVDTTPGPAPPPQATYVAPMPTVPVIPKDTPKVQAPPPAQKDDRMKLPSFSAPKLPSFGGGGDSGSDASVGAPSLPSMPNMPSTPSMPSMPSIPKLDVPSFSAPKLPSMPSFGGGADSGSDTSVGAPSLPSMPSMPSMPSIPKLDMPSFSAPKLPSMPSFGGGSDDSLPRAPPAPTKPIVPPSRPAVPAPKPLPVTPPPPPKPLPVTPPSPPKPLPVTPPPPPAPKPLPPLPPPPVPKFTKPNVVMPESAPRSTQGDTLEQWRKQQKKDLLERQKRESQAAKRNMKRGGMPTALAEILLLAIFGGLGFVTIALGDSIGAVYKKVDKFLLGLFPRQK